MGSIAWNIGTTFCQLSDALNVSGYFGQACVQPRQFGYILAISFVVALALIWLFKPKREEGA